MTPAPQLALNRARLRADRAATARRLQHLALAAGLCLAALALAHAALSTARDLPELLARAAAESALQ
jgi:hypothetical protein